MEYESFHEDEISNENMLEDSENLLESEGLLEDSENLRRFRRYIRTRRV